MKDIKPKGGIFDINLEPESITTLTSTSGQDKGLAKPASPVSFPFPYADDFKSYSVGNQPKFFSDLEGTFEVVLDEKGTKCLEQAITRVPIRWATVYRNLSDKDCFPFTVLGDSHWTNYLVRVDVLIDEPGGEISLLGHVNAVTIPFKEVAFPGMVQLKVQDSGQWELWKGVPGEILSIIDGVFRPGQFVCLASGRVSFSKGIWHQLILSFKGSNIQAYIDGSCITSVQDSNHPTSGAVGLGSGWNKAKYANIEIKPL